MEIKSNKFHRDYKKKELPRLIATDERYPDGSVANEIEITALLFLTCIIFRNTKGGTKGRTLSSCLCPA